VPAADNEERGGQLQHAVIRNFEARIASSGFGCRTGRQSKIQTRTVAAQLLLGGLTRLPQVSSGPTLRQ
jgi:hypothetical protein